MIWPGPIAGERARVSGPLAFMASILCTQTGTGVQTNSTTGAIGGAQNINTNGATLLVAIIRSVTGTSFTATITDSEGNAWNYGAQYGSPSHAAQIAVAWVSNPTTSATHSFTANNQDGSAEVYAFSGGSGASWSLDSQLGSSGATSGASVTVGNITPAGAGEVVICGISSNNSIVTGTVDTGFSGGIVGDPTDTALCMQLSGIPEVGGSGYFITTSGTSLQPTFTMSGSNPDWQWTIAAFKQ